MYQLCVYIFFFFFKQKTAYEIYQCDWSSDVCSSDLFSKLSPINSIPITTKQEDNPVNLTFVTTKQDAFIKSLEPENAWVVNKTETDITVFSPICPHLGCRYSWHPEQKLFICPCHNSIFTIDGKLVSGPALRGLDTLPIKKKDGTLYVLWERFKLGIAQKIVIGD